MVFRTIKNNGIGYIISVLKDVVHAMSSYKEEQIA